MKTYKLCQNRLAIRLTKHWHSTTYIRIENIADYLLGLAGISTLFLQILLIMQRLTYWCIWQSVPCSKRQYTARSRWRSSNTLGWYSWEMEGRQNIYWHTVDKANAPLSELHRSVGTKRELSRQIIIVQFSYRSLCRSSPMVTRVLLQVQALGPLQTAYVVTRHEKVSNCEVCKASPLLWIEQGWPTRGSLPGFRRLLRNYQKFH